MRSFRIVNAGRLLLAVPPAGISTLSFMKDLIVDPLMPMR